MQAFFATSASISPPLRITDPEPPCSKKIVLKLWSSSETTAQVSSYSRHRYATLFDWNVRTIRSTVHRSLDLLDARFKAISSLKEVIVDVHIYDDEGLSDDLRKKMRDCGWTIKVTKLEESSYSREEDEYVDYESYVEMEREQEKEDEAWVEEYYRRRRDPYWKNDSDYD